MAGSVSGTILVINPNSTSEMTEEIAATARQTLQERGAGKQYRVVAATNESAPPAIQGPEDGAAAVPGVLALIEGAEETASAFIIACFDDTGLEEARAMTSKPVVGIGEASYRRAARLHQQFAVVTTVQEAVPVLQGNVEAGGFGGNCVGVCAADVPVLELESNPSAAVDRLSSRIAEFEADGRCKAIVLGCAGMSYVKPQLSFRHDIPLLCPVGCAVLEIVEALDASS